MAMLPKATPASVDVSRPRSFLQDFTSALPCEIVGEVFSFLPFPTPGELSKHGETSARPPWMRVSHVCRRWREVATHHRRMWSTISTAQYDLFTLALKRSASLPLTISFMRDRPTYVNPSRNDGFTSIPRRVFDLLALKALPRVRSMALSLGPEGNHDMLWKHPAPALESLTLSAVRRCVYSPTLDVYTVVSEALPDDMFEAQTPRLDTLRLNVVDIHPTLPFFTDRLRTLELKGVRCYTLTGKTPIEHDPEALLEALRRAPNLEELTIISPLSDEVESERVVEEGTHVPSVPLGRLRKLVLEDYAPNLPGFIRRLQLPQTCGIALRTVRTQNRHLRAVLDIVLATFPPRPDPDREATFFYRKVLISGQAADRGSWSPRRPCRIVRIVASEPQDPSLPDHLEITVDLDEDTDISLVLIALIYYFPPCICRARVLVVDHPFFASGTSWKPTLEPFKDVMELAVSPKIAKLPEKATENLEKEVVVMEVVEVDEVVEVVEVVEVDEEEEEETPLFKKLETARYVYEDGRDEPAW